MENLLFLDTIEFWLGIQNRGEESKVIDYETAVLGILGATLFPVWISLYVVTNLKFVKLQFLAMAGIGLTFWFFYVTMGNAAAVGVSGGFGGGLPHLGVVIV